VVDTLPPVITPGDDEICIWPPDHQYVCFDKEDFDPEIAEICHEYDWMFVDCASRPNETVAIPKVVVM